MVHAFMTPINIVLEVSQKRSIAIARDWPGWARSGCDEAAAIQALYVYAERYARVVHAAGLPFRLPASPAELLVVERLHGNATTEFGVPNLAFPNDTDPVLPAELQHWQQIIQACWQAFDRAVQAAAGQALRTGPRGGGRDLNRLTQHVYEANVSYLASLGGTWRGTYTEPGQAFASMREAILSTLVAAAHGELPTHGPRGGQRWTPRAFVRRIAWHDLDHAWELEDRMPTT